MLTPWRAPETIVQPGANLVDRQDLHAGGGRFEGERDAIEPPADIGYRGGVAMPKSGANFALDDIAAR